MVVKRENNIRNSAESREFDLLRTLDVWIGFKAGVQRWRFAHDSNDQLSRARVSSDRVQVHRGDDKRSKLEKYVDPKVCLDFFLRHAAWLGAAH